MRNVHSHALADTAVLILTPGSFWNVSQWHPAPYLSNSSVCSFARLRSECLRLCDRLLLTHGQDAVQPTLTLSLTLVSTAID